MGILNVTPDSFSDGGRYATLDHARSQAQKMILEGADIIDVGGESTRPGAKSIGLQEELDRVVPVLEALASDGPVALSIDTQKPLVMEEAVNAGAILVNDVNALQAEGAIDTVVNLGVSVCLMHMRGVPQTMQSDPQYAEVVKEVKGFLVERAEACMAAGLAPEDIIIDPGFGFGKTVEQNYALFAQLHTFAQLPYSLLVGVSRKSMIGAIIDAPPDERVLGSAVLAALAVERGAQILRVHDVKETRQALALLEQVERNVLKGGKRML